MEKTKALHEYEYVVYNRHNFVHTKKHGEDKWQVWVSDPAHWGYTPDLSGSILSLKETPMGLATKFGGVSPQGSKVFTLTTRDVASYDRDKLFEIVSGKHGGYIVKKFEFSPSACEKELDVLGRIKLKKGRQVRLKRVEGEHEFIRGEIFLRSGNRFRPYAGDRRIFDTAKLADEVYMLSDHGDLYDVVNVGTDTYEFIRHDETQSVEEQTPVYVATTNAVTTNAAATSIVKDIAVGVGTTLAVDMGVDVITRKLALIAIRNSRHDIAELLIDKAARGVMKVVMPATLLGVAYAFCDSDDKSTRELCSAIIPSLKVAVMKHGADNITAAFLTLMNDEGEEIDEIKDAIEMSYKRLELAAKNGE